VEVSLCTQFKGVSLKDKNNSNFWDFFQILGRFITLLSNLNIYKSILLDIEYQKPTLHTPKSLKR